MEVSLRPAEPGDAERLAEIVEASYAPYVERIGARPRPMDDDYGELVRRGVLTVAERDGDPIGLVALDEAEGRFEVDNLAVDPAHRGTGAGRALLEHAEAEALRSGFDAIHLFTHETMTESLSLYEAIGYVEYERRDVGAGSLVFMRKGLRNR